VVATNLTVVRLIFLAQGKEEGGAGAGLGIQPDTASVGFHQPLADYQTETNPFGFVFDSQPAEGFKQVLLILGGDAHSLVANADDGLVVLPAGKDSDLAPFRGVFAGVVDQVGEDAFQPDRVDVYRTQSAGMSSKNTCLGC